jgi:hypothetical protein
MWGADWDPNVVFKVDPTVVGRGKNGNNDVKWYVWDECEKLVSLDIELYSIMRAEYYFIEKGYKKCEAGYRGNLGIDNFFVKKPQKTGGPKYILCESKFTCQEEEFTRWKDKEKEDKEKYVWGLMKKYDTKKSVKKYPQMSWQWLRDRTGLALQHFRKHHKEDKEEAKRQLKNLQKHVSTTIKRRSLKRYVNYFGAERVPIYPGRYKLVTGLRNRETETVFHLKWNLRKEIDFEAEFIELGEDFDKWCQERADSS